MENFSWTEIGIIVSAIGGLITLLLLIIGFFAVRWMNTREKKEAQRDDDDAKEKEKREEKEADIRAELVTTTAQIAHDLAKRHSDSVAEIKKEIKGNRTVYIQHYENTVAQIKEMDLRLVKRMDTANGRTKKLETKNSVLTKAVNKVSATCEERSNAFYKEAEKSAKKKCK